MKTLSCPMNFDTTLDAMVAIRTMGLRAHGVVYHPSLQGSYEQCFGKKEHGRSDPDLQEGHWYLITASPDGTVVGQYPTEATR